MTTTALSNVEDTRALGQSLLTDGHGPITISSIRNLARRIASRFQPEKIILFGSYAYGKPGPDSDVDLLVVMDTSLSSRQQRPEISQAISPRPFPLDIVVRMPKELEERLKLGDPFLCEVMTQGRVIYERPHI